MWKDYSKGYLKNNRASGISVMTAAFISALLLSLLCSLFYNLWAYEVERVKADVGDWEGRLNGGDQRGGPGAHPKLRKCGEGGSP